MMMPLYQTVCSRYVFVILLLLYLVYIVYLTNDIRRFYVINGNQPNDVRRPDVVNRNQPILRLLVLTNFASAYNKTAGCAYSNEQVRCHVPHVTRPRSSPILSATPLHHAYDLRVITTARRCRLSIPLYIFQTWKTSDVGTRMYEAISSWQEMNPEYLHILFDDTTAKLYVDSWMTFNNKQKELNSIYVGTTPSNVTSFNNAINTVVGDCTTVVDKVTTPISFSSSDIAAVKEAYYKLEIGASKADLFRYMVIYEFGGTYFDIDSACKRPLREYVQGNSEVVTFIGERRDIAQWALIYTSHHPIIARAIQIVINTVQSNTVRWLSSNVEAVSGPPVLHQSIKSVLCSSLYTHLYDTIQVMHNDMFNNRVTFKIAGVDEEGRKMGHVHWFEKQKQARRDKQ